LFLQPLFQSYQVLEFSGGVIFRGPASDYCLNHREQVADGLRRLPGAHAFEELDGRTMLTYTAPAPHVKPVNRVLHTVLFLLTVLTTLVAGAHWRFDQFVAELIGGLAGAPGSVSVGALFGDLVSSGWRFSLAILAILGAHESGHYLMARRYGMLVTPPFFLPAPIPPIGTFGALIKIRSPMMHKRALLDIGLAGPVSGVIVALPILLVGLCQSQFEIVRYWDPNEIQFGHSLLTWLLTRLTLGVPEPGYALNWLANPLAWAGWIGLLVTMLNLIPVGQLDGGHVVYALFGRRQRLVAWFFFGVLVALAYTQWPGWAVWILIITVLMRATHPPVVIDDVRLNARRRLIGWAALVFFVLVFMPAPVSVAG
jgi:hypothetical protein